MGWVSQSKNKSLKTWPINRKKRNENLKGFCFWILVKNIYTNPEIESMINTK